VAAGVGRVAGAFAIDADTGEIDLFVRRLRLLRPAGLVSEIAAGDPKTNARRGGRLKKIASVGAFTHCWNS
jgi:hypothetical protein